MSQNLEQIQTLLDLKYRRSRAGISQILQQEASLRADLEKLARQEAENRHDDIQKMKAIGADVLWQAWLGRMRAQLNRELALVLAQKEIVMKSVRQDFGRLSVSGQLLRSSLEAERATAAKNMLEEAIDLAFTKSKAP